MSNVTMLLLCYSKHGLCTKQACVDPNCQDLKIHIISFSYYFLRENVPSPRIALTMPPMGFHAKKKTNTKVGYFVYYKQRFVRENIFYRLCSRKSARLSLMSIRFNVNGLRIICSFKSKPNFVGIERTRVVGQTVMIIQTTKRFFRFD